MKMTTTKQKGNEKKMKAIVYDKSKYPDILAVRDVEKPVPQDNEVLVKIHAVSLNAADYRSMQMGIIPKRKIFGADIAGRVEDVGKNIKNFKVGDEVFGDIARSGFGGLAEYAVAPERLLALKPSNVSFEDAAAIPMASVTALQALRDLGNIQKGQKVLICGAGGGVGNFAVQLAKYFGAEVTAVCSKENADIVRSIGADTVIDYKKEDFTKSGKHYDLVLAVNGNHSLFAYRRTLTSHGVFVMAGGSLSQLFSTIIFGSLLSIGSKKIRHLSTKHNRKDLELVMKLVEAGKVKPIIDRRYPLDRTAEAMRYLSEGHARGKVIITVI
jgi:2-desacetyl-2-hydroxyethyl bacteriochlorophyllide A dehydrogenase